MVDGDNVGMYVEDCLALVAGCLEYCDAEEWKEICVAVRLFFHSSVFGPSTPCLMIYFLIITTLSLMIS